MSALLKGVEDLNAALLETWEDSLDYSADVWPVDSETRKLVEARLRGATREHRF